MTHDLWQIFGAWAVTLLMILAGFWAFIERTFVRRDVQASNDVRSDERHNQLRADIASIQVQLTQLPEGIKQACILGVHEGAKIVRAEVRAARAIARLSPRHQHRRSGDGE